MQWVAWLLEGDPGLSERIIQPISEYSPGFLFDSQDFNLDFPFSKIKFVDFSIFYDQITKDGQRCSCSTIFTIVLYAFDGNFTGC